MSDMGLINRRDAETQRKISFYFAVIGFVKMRRFDLVASFASRHAAGAMDDQNRKAHWILLACLALFLIATACKINGSSIGIWSAILHDPATADSLLLSTPKSIRSDEWLVWTPSMLSQANHIPPFPVENESLGAGKSTLLMNLPARHYSMFFRPQLYGFFFLDTATAYAWYWNMKIFGLIAAMFLLLRKLMGNNTGLALGGSLWVFLSGFVQWWFSCPPMLPEMLASWALVLVGIMTILTSQKPWVKVCTAIGVIICALNFAFCMYPPFQIPLVYLGMVVLAGWLWERRNKKLPLHLDRVAVACLLGAGIIIAGVFGAFLVECKPTLDLVAATSYPGARGHGTAGFGFGARGAVYVATKLPGKIWQRLRGREFLSLVDRRGAGCHFRIPQTVAGKYAPTGFDGLSAWSGGFLRLQAARMVVPRHLVEFYH
jgi:hypothetical protein